MCTDSDADLDEDISETEAAGKRKKNRGKTAQINSTKKESTSTEIKEQQSDDDLEENCFLHDSSIDSIDGDCPKQRKEAKVKFKEPVGGKIKPKESRTGKGPQERRNRDDEMFYVDQTLAGTFSDVSDVFGKILDKQKLKMKAVICLY